MSIARGIQKYLKDKFNNNDYEKLIDFKKQFQLTKNVFLVSVFYFESVQHINVYSPFTLFASCLLVALKTCEDDRWMSSYVSQSLGVDMKTIVTIERLILTNINYQLIDIEGVLKTRTQLKQLSDTQLVVT